MKVTETLSRELKVTNRSGMSMEGWGNTVKIHYVLCRSIWMKDDLTKLSATHNEYVCTNDKKKLKKI